MQFNITYSRPKQPRIESGWVKAKSAGYKDTILYTYAEHGFKVYEVDKSRYILSHITDGVRVVRFKD